MRRPFCVLAALAVLGAATAHAGTGVNLRWTNCLGDGGAFNRNFACDTNAGTHVLVSSFELQADMPHVTGLEGAVDFAVASETLPAWWAFKNTGSCRMTSLNVSFSEPLGAVNCLDWAMGQGLGGIVSYNPGIKGANTARVLIGEAALSAMSLDAGLEYFAFSLLINNAKTVGTGSCAGCTVPACLTFNSVKLTTGTPADDRIISGATNLTDSFFATWQGPSPVPPGGKPCPWPTPTKRETWGAVKSLYR